LSAAHESAAHQSYTNYPHKNHQPHKISPKPGRLFPRKCRFDSYRPAGVMGYDERGK